MAEALVKSWATRLIERLLRIPPEPHAPAGTHESVLTFRAAKGFYKLQLIMWFFRALTAGVGLMFGVYFVSLIPQFPGRFVLDILEALAVLSYLATLPFTFLMVHLDYQLRWYIITDRSLRIRDGLVHISEKTMSFANIQNIAVKQGPFQRFLGIADVEVRTAGGGGSSPHDKQGIGTPTHLAYFKGVDNAEEIRDAILARVRLLRDTGLGDPEHAHAPVAALDPGAVDAATALLREVRALRALAAP